MSERWSRERREFIRSFPARWRLTLLLRLIELGGNMRQTRKRFSRAIASPKIWAGRAGRLLSVFVAAFVLKGAAQIIISPGNPVPTPRELPAPVTVIHSFTAATNSGPFYFGYTNVDGAFCKAALVRGSDDKLYGVAPGGGDFGSGTVFKLSRDGSDFTVLHAFTTLPPRAGPSNSDGMIPTGLISGNDGKLYGTASRGGSNGFGAIFKLNTDGSSFTNLHSFAASDGQNPQGGVIQGPDGMLYGTAQNGGANGSGTVFKVGPDGQNFTVLYGFTALIDGTNSDGIQPYSGLLLSGDTLYGTARYGGPTGSIRASDQLPIGSGTLFSLKTNGTGFTVVHSFDTFSVEHLFPTNKDGASPYSALILGKDGKIYGTAPEAGVGGYGTIFSAGTDGSNYTVLYAFGTPLHTFFGGYGLAPYGGLVEGDDGKLYGAAYVGGYNAGTVYRLNRDGSGLALLHSFTRPDPVTDTNIDGFNPFATLLKGNDGKMYGVTSAGGANNSGTLFSFAPPIALEFATSNRFVQLTWPISATNFFLETSDRLASGSIWTALTNNIGIEGDDFSLTLPATNGAAFFRLHQSQ